MSIELLQGDCLIEAKKIKSGSVDLILTDLPYGNMRGAQLDSWDGTKTNWDNAIAPSKVHKLANRILRRNGKLVLFSQEPYTTRLITEAIPNLPFGYRMIWEKDHFANALLVNKAPVSFYEDILLFSKSHPKHDFEGKHPLRDYFAEVLEYIGLGLKCKGGINDALGHRRAEHTFYIKSNQFSLCTSETYEELIKKFGINNMQGFKPFSELKVINEGYREDLLQRMNDENPSVFNLWEGGKYKSNILRYKKDYDGYHPTQKPVLLLEDLVKTFSNEGDLVVDLTMGSGSTGVACKNTGRNFIGVELDEEYFKIAKDRIDEIN